MIRPLKLLKMVRNPPYIIALCFLTAFNSKILWWNIIRAEMCWVCFYFISFVQLKNYNKKESSCQLVLKVRWQWLLCPRPHARGQNVPAWGQSGLGGGERENWEGGKGGGSGQKKEWELIKVFGQRSEECIYTTRNKWVTDESSYISLE